MIEVAFLVLMFHFQIRQSRVASGAPVDDVVPAVDEPLLVKAHKNFLNGFRKSFIHGKPFTAPVAGTTQSSQLVNNQSAVFFAPFPYPFDELFPAHGMPVGPLSCQVSLHHVLGGDAGMIGSGLPKHIVPGHFLVTAQNILEGIVQSMPHVKGPGHVRGRDNNTVRGFFRKRRWLKQVVFLPVLIPFLFNFPGFITFGYGFFFHR